ncbi:MAG: hypothetical protein HYR63_06955 [Proteobacteria bacterium]|nr:hypothetical protein [Pseudomonadota bacterium]MBI3498727.1 hypothetical protein [Pseudomonadota bacterium]
MAMAIKDGRDAAGFLELRKQQAKMASEFLAWNQQLVVLATSWCCDAMRFLGAVSGKRRPTDNNVLDAFNARAMQVHRASSEALFVRK